MLHLSPQNDFCSGIKYNLFIYKNKTKPLTKDFLETLIYHVTQSHLVILVIAIILSIDC